MINEKICKTLVVKNILGMESRDFHGKCILLSVFFVLSFYVFDVFGVYTKLHVLICIGGKGN